MTIFADNAPAYWARGVPVIPIIPALKRPAIAGWQMLADRMPTEEERALWLQIYPNHNIGVVNGPVSGLVSIDVDRDDPRVMSIIDRVLPKSPWARVGKKGVVLAYRFEGNRTFRIRDADGMIMECLSKGTQIVLPPSIHPDTKRPYVSNVPLLDVINALPVLPREAETILREALKDEGFAIDIGGSTAISSFVPAGARDNALVAHAGILSRAIVRGERSLLDAMAEIKHWVETYPEKIAGDAMDPVKAQHKVVEFLFKDVTGEKRRTLPEGWDEGLTEEDKKNLGLDFSEEAERWDMDRLFQFLRFEFERHVEPESQGWSMAVDTVLDRIARNPSFSRLDEEKIMKFIANQSKGLFTLGTLRRQLQNLRLGEIAGNDHTEIAKAVIKDLSVYGEIRFDLGTFYQWKGACWETMRESELLRHIADEYGSLPAVRRFNDHKAVIGVMRSECEKELIQSNVVGVNFANGFLTDDLVLRPHNPDYGMTYVLPYRYMSENSNCPLFMQFLSDCWGEDADYRDKVLALQEAMAATLFGLAPRYQRAFCLIGEPGSGKTRITELMKGLMPDRSHSQIPPSDWDDKFLPAQMAGKLLNFAGEISESKQIAGDRFKQIVEGQTISAQHKNQPPFSFTSRAAQWFASNHTPKTRDTSDGFNRRWLFLEFPRRVAKENMVRDLEKILLSFEREQIVAWAVQGLTRLQENNDYTLPMSHMTLVDEMAASNNSVRYFLSQNPRLRVGRRQHEGCNPSQIHITGQRLFDEYWSFCAQTGGVSRVVPVKFHALMRELRHSFDFEISKETTTHGSNQVIYNFITIAAKSAV